MRRRSTYIAPRTAWKDVGLLLGGLIQALGIIASVWVIWVALWMMS